jgi:hypothetical protein
MTIEHRQPLIKCNCCGIRAEMPKGQHGPLKPGGWGTISLYPALAENVCGDACPTCFNEINRLLIEYRGERQLEGEL